MIVDRKDARVLAQIAVVFCAVLLAFVALGFALGLAVRVFLIVAYAGM